ncbi:MAG: hypothetical protein KGJ57_19985 [Sphingomonadales bacterium]|nr:hypothetical protein [Sphingomonadales bacterium]MDE2171676.1 hypothetical protein [Sphingomonadales bacterium]
MALFLGGREHFWPLRGFFAFQAAILGDEVSMGRYRSFGIALQLPMVFFTVAICCYFVTIQDFNSPLNLIWMIGLPLGIAIRFNKRPRVKAAMAVVLLACAFGSMAMIVYYTGA